MYLVWKWLFILFAGAGVVVGVILDPYFKGRNGWGTEQSVAVLITVGAILGNLALWRYAARSVTPGGNDAIQHYLAPIITGVGFLLGSLGMLFM